MSTQTVVRDLHDEIVSAAALPIRAKAAWVRRITGVDRTKRDTYAFTGPGFLADGTIQVALGVPRLYLVGGDDGGRYATKYYRFVVMEPDGSLTPTDIQEMDTKAGWALRVRDRVQALLDAHAAFAAASPAPAPTPPTATAAAPTTATAPVPDSPTPDDGIRPVLVALVRQHGAGILGDQRRLVALLHDACGDRYSLEQRLLTMALSAGVVEALRAPANGTPPSLRDAHLAERLVSQWGIYHSLAAWSVSVWQEAL